MVGNFLPIQLMYQGKTKLCQAEYNFSNEFHVTQTPNNWADENTSIEMIKKILIPYIKPKQEELNFPNKHWLLICDVFKGQWTEAVKNVVKESNGKMVSVHQTNGSWKAFRSDQGRCLCLCGETATCKMDCQVL